MKAVPDFRNDARQSRFPQRCAFILIQADKCFRADPGEDKTKPGFVLVRTVTVAVEEALDRLGNLEDFFGKDKGFNGNSRPRPGAHAAAREHGESPAAVLYPGKEAQVGNGCLPAVIVATGKGNFELARQVEGIPMLEQVFRQGNRVRGGIEQFTGALSRRAGGNVAYRIAAAAPGGQARFQQALQHGRGVFDRNAMNLDVLPCRNMEDAVAVASAQSGHCAEVFRRGEARGDADTHHVPA